MAVSKRLRYLESAASIAVLVSQFDEAHEDDENPDGTAIEYRWPDDVKAVIAAVADLVEQHWQAQGVIADALEEIAGDRRSELIAEAYREYVELGVPRLRQENLERRALVIALRRALVS